MYLYDVLCVSEKAHINHSHRRDTAHCQPSIRHNANDKLYVKLMSFPPPLSMVRVWLTYANVCLVFFFVSFFLVVAYLNVSERTLFVSHIHEHRKHHNGHNLHTATQEYIQNKVY